MALEPIAEGSTEGENNGNVIGNLDIMQLIVNAHESLIGNRASTSLTG